MNHRYRISKSELKEIFSDLQKRGYSLRKITNIVPGFSDSLYSGYTLSEKSYKNLVSLYGKKIEFTTEIPNKNINVSNIEIDELFAEIIGILLGDGSIGHYIDKRNKNLYIIEFSFNGIDEKPYLLYVCNLLIKKFGKKPYYRQRKRSKAAYLRYQDKSLYNFLLSVGMMSGNKIKNQVNVPNWIKKDSNYSIKCLKGLFDTDGSIFLDKRYNLIMLEFRNHSQPLLNDFRTMCESLDIKPSPKGKNRVKIQSKKEVKHFLEIIQPFKWKAFQQRIPHFKDYL